MEGKGSPVYRKWIADYLDTGTEEVPDIRVMNVFTTVDEEPTAQEEQKHYTSDASATTFTTGYQTKFPIKGDMYTDNKVAEFIRDIGEEQKLGVQANYYRVRLYQPIEGKTNTFYARKFRVGFAISTIGGEGGKIVGIEGNMNALGDAVIGEFNTTTQTFTAKADIPPLGGGETEEAF